MERKVRVASGFARPPRRRLRPHGDFFRLARTRDFCHPLEAGHRLAMALDRWCSRATSCRNSPSGKMLPAGRFDRTLPTCSHRARKQTAHQPAIMLTAPLWTPSGVACTDTARATTQATSSGNQSRPGTCTPSEASGRTRPRTRAIPLSWGTPSHHRCRAAASPSHGRTSGHELYGVDGRYHSDSGFAAEHPSCCDGSSAH